MRCATMFSGIGAPEAAVATAALGWELAWTAEIEPFPKAVLECRFPGVPNLGDVRAVTEEQVKAGGPLDVIIFGFPCQDLSVAGQRRGLHHEGERTRSGLFFDAMRVVRWSGARWAVAENVPGLFSSNGRRDFAAVVGEMAGCELDIPGDGWKNVGAAAGEDALVEWAVLDAQWFGVPQRRRRVFLVRDTGDWAGRPPLLLEQESLSGDPEAGGKPRKSPAPKAGGRPPGGGGGAGVTTYKKRGGFGWSETQGLSPTLESEGGSHQGGSERIPVALEPTIFQDSEFGAREYDTAGSLRAGREPHHQLVVGGPINFPAGSRGGWAPPSCPTAEDVALPLDATRISAVCYDADDNAAPHVDVTETLAQGTTVRRLTPLECERLQGFPDAWTDVTFRGRSAADGPRYKALGNAMAVPVLAWICKKLQEAHGHQ